MGCFCQIPECSQLHDYQLTCSEPKIDPDTYEAENCRSNGTVVIYCQPSSPLIVCSGPQNFTREQPCRWTNGYSFSTALAISISCGLCGIDRCWLGYPVLGMIKVMTFGGFLIGYWMDVMAISLQIVRPADGSHYIVFPGGPRQIPYRFNNQTSVF